MAAGVHVFARHEVVRVGIAPATDDVVDTSSFVIEAIGYGIIEDRRKQPQVGLLRLEPVARGQVRRVYLPHLARVEPLAWIAEAPAFHVRDLHAMAAHHAPQVPGGDPPRTRVAREYQQV